MAQKDKAIDTIDNLIANNPGLKKSTGDLKNHFPAPVLPAVPTEQRPHILVVDDDDRAFLYPLREQHRLAKYADTFTLHTLHLTRQSDVLPEITRKIQTYDHLSALFLDRGQDVGLPTSKIIQGLRKHEASRYLPIAVITKSMVQDLKDTDQLLSHGAQRVIFNKRANATFLYELYTSLEQLQEAIQQKKWLDLWETINTTARQQADKLDENSEAEILTALQKHLIDYMGHSCCIIREITANGTLKLLPSCGPEFDDLPQSFLPEQVPFIQDLLNSDQTIAQHIEHLNTAQLGILASSSLNGQHVLACVMRHGMNILGTVTLYRKSDQPPFKQTDITFMTSFAIDLGNLLGARRARQRLYDRQNHLLDFIAYVDGETKEDAIIEKLLDSLHQDIHYNNKTNAKTTLRLVDSITGEIKRKGRPHGLKNQFEPIITLETKESTYTQAINSGKPLRSGDMGKDSRIQLDNTLPEIQSCLVVPMMAGKLCLGAINLESKNRRAYNKSDEMYAASLARISGDALEELRAREFQTKLLTSFHSLLNQDYTELSFVDEIYRISSDYFGFARLLNLQKLPNSTSSWEVNQVVDRNSSLYDNKKTQLWNDHIQKNWGSANIKLILDEENPGAKFIPDNNIDIPDGENKDLKIRSMAIVPLYRSPETAPDSALVLLFRLQHAINDSHLKMLQLLGELLNAARYYQAKVSEYLIQAMAKTNLEELGESATQSRHSLVNQLGAITNMIELFKDNLCEKEQFLNQITELVERLKRSVDRKRHWIKSPEPTTCDVRQIWQTTAAEFSTNARSKYITIETAGSDIPLHTDPDILDIIFFNLIQNALEACPEGSRIWLDHITTESGHVKVQICDDGPGIAPSVQSTLFDLGITTKSTGSGFGLYFTRRRIHDLKGEITLQPQKTGTCFQLTLPNKCNKRNEKEI